MNRRTKIIVSVSGIFIVALALIGLTYAYFLTRINGNTNAKSISVSTANLELTYGDGNGTITSNNIMPGTTLESKEFSVRNDGEDTSYIVVLEDVEVTDSSNNVTTFESNDFIYTLICTEDCNGAENEVLPLNNGILVSNDIKKDTTQNYELIVTYKETGLDQSADMGKALSAKVNISTVERFNPYLKQTSSLAYNIIDNAMLVKNGTELLANPKSKVAKETSLFKYNITDPEEAIEETNITLNTTYQGYYWTYGTGYTIDENTGKFTLTGVSTCKYDDGTCNNILVNNYIVSPYVSSSSSESNTPKVTSNLSSIYKVITAPESGIDSITMTAKRLTATSYGVEKELSIARDDYGYSYYYRGDVNDNYVTYADMCWRIVRIEGDGSIKLILEDQDEPCSSNINENWAIPTTTNGKTYSGTFGYTLYNAETLTSSDGTKNSSNRSIMDYLHGTTSSDRSMAMAFKNFQKTFTEVELSKLKSGDWCLGDKGYSRSGSYPNYTYKLLTEKEILDYKIKGVNWVFYDSYVRLSGENLNGYQPTFKCNGTIMNNWEDNVEKSTPMYVGTITADEIVYAGGKISSINQNYYLINEEFKKEANISNKAASFWSLSPYYFRDNFDSVLNLYRNGSFGSGSCSNCSSVYWNDIHFRPSVSLSSGVQISNGDGTLENSYVIK